jgi:hypothetical protein
MNMKVKMLASKMGSNDGITTKLYEKDETYEVSEDLGNSFLSEKLAEVVNDDVTEPAQKANPAAPQNKAVAKAPENKAQ